MSETKQTPGEQEKERITTVTHITQPYDVYIGRRGKGQDGYYGNPHPVGYCAACLETHDREQAIAAYVRYFLARIEDDKTFRNRIEALKGKTLGCFCHPRECHGDVIVRWLEETHTQEDDDADPIPGDRRPTAPTPEEDHNIYVEEALLEEMEEEEETETPSQTDDPAPTKERDPAVIGIIGSRRRDTPADHKLVTAALEKIMRDGDTLVSGGCPTGADHMAEKLAKEKGLTITIHYPDWNRYGKRAGFERNGKIALDADILIACVAPDRKGGTEDTIRKYRDLGKGQLILV